MFDSPKIEATKAAPPIIEFNLVNLELPFSSIRADCFAALKVFKRAGKAAAKVVADAAAA